MLDLLSRMRLLAPADPLRSSGEGLSEEYAGELPQGRQATDVRAARPGGGKGWVLLAAAARYATRVTVRTTGPEPESIDTQQELPQ